MDLFRIDSPRTEQVPNISDLIASRSHVYFFLLAHFDELGLSERLQETIILGLTFIKITTDCIKPISNLIIAINFK